MNWATRVLLCVSCLAVATFVVVLVVLPPLGTAPYSLEAAMADPSAVRKLAVLDKGLTEVPPEIQRLNRLVYLYLSGNKIRNLPPWLVKNPKIRSLWLSDNEITDFPLEITQMPNLRRLDLNYNSITNIPPEIGLLTKLDSLDLEQNQIDSLPPEIGRLRRLDYLKVGGNRLRTLPKEIGDLVDLECLVLSENELKELPPSLVNLRRLRRLFLDHNQFTRVPPQLLALENLELLCLNGNPIPEYQIEELRHHLPETEINPVVFDRVPRGGKKPTTPVRGRPPAYVNETDVPTIGKPWTVPGLGQELVFVEAGSFMMGSEDGQGNEKPVHDVRITQPFWIGKYEVTQTEYEAVTGANPSRFKGPKKPVEMVSWNDAVAFCAKLAVREREAGRLPGRYEFRLPTEAEWEYVARGGSGGLDTESAGGDVPDEVAWYKDNSGRKTHEVGGKKPNELGLYDMSGNVWELCLDGYPPSDHYAKSASVDPIGPAGASGRVMRGGGWDSGATRCRVASRFRCYPRATNGAIGFRVVLAPPPIKKPASRRLRPWVPPRTQRR